MNMTNMRNLNKIKALDRVGIRRTLVNIERVAQLIFSDVLITCDLENIWVEYTSKFQTHLDKMQKLNAFNHCSYYIDSAYTNSAIVSLSILPYNCKDVSKNYISLNISLNIETHPMYDFTHNIIRKTKHMTNIRPLRDRIVVQPNAPTAQTVGGVIIPIQSQDASNEGVVIAVGPGWVQPTTGKLEPVSVNINDTIIYNKEAGTSVIVEGEEFVIIHEQDIMAVIS